MTDREKAIEVLRLSEPMQKTHSLMETAICIAERESYLTDEEEATLRKAVELAIQALEQTRWIPVSERLPEEGENVLVTIYHKGCIPVIEKTRLTDYTYWMGLGRDVNVRAWMPLPQPYKWESEDKE